jgi:hypothetical protein
MRPVELEPSEGWKNVIIAGRPGLDNNLVAARQGHEFYTLWDLSFAERRAILDGAKVEIWFTQTMPGFNPMSVTVQGVDEARADEGGA